MAVDSIDNIQSNREKYAKYFSSTSNDEMSMDTFYKLLSAEMSNQDPMEPMSNTEFISQMASFTSLQTQKDALYYSNANYAQSIVGKSVTVATVNGSEVYSESGIVTSMSLSNGEFKVKVNGKSYALANIMEVLPTTNPYTVSGNDAAYATSLIGKKVTLNTVNSEGKAIVETGTVQRVEIKDSDITVVIDNIAYPLASVVKIENAEEVNKNTDEPTDDGDEDGDDDVQSTSNSSSSGTSGTKNEDEVNTTESSSETSIYEELAEYTGEPDEPDLIDDSEELNALFG